MHVRPMTRADFSACAALGCAAFLDDSYTALQFPHRRRFPEAYHRAVIQRVQAAFVKPGNWCNVCVEDVNGKEEILGYAVWNRQTEGRGSTGSKSPYLKNNNNVGAWLERTLRKCEEIYTFNARLNPAMDRAFMQQYVRSSNPIAGPFAPLPDHWYLASLSVHPNHQRKGVGSVLLQWGIDRCWEESAVYGGAPLPAALIASRMGHGLYLKRGFRVMAWLGEELNLSSGAAMVWDQNELFTRSLQDGEPTVTKGGNPIDAVFRGEEEQKLAKLERTAGFVDIIKLDNDEHSTESMQSYTTESSKQGFVVTSTNHSTSST